MKRGWAGLSASDKAFALLALLLAAAIGAVGTALRDRDRTHEPVPAILELKAAVQ